MTTTISTLARSTRAPVIELSAERMLRRYGHRRLTPAETAELAALNTADARIVWAAAQATLELSRQARAAAEACSRFVGAHLRRAAPAQ